MLSVASRKKRDLLTLLTGPVFSGAGRFGGVRIARVLFDGHRTGLPPAQARSDLLRSPRVITERSVVMTRGTGPVMPTAGARFFR